MKLGLTQLQAKTYLTLTQLDNAEVKRIARISGIARQDIYRIMPTLEKLGLAEKIVATPILYKAVPLKDGTSSLFQERSSEHAQLEASLKTLAASKEKSDNNIVQDAKTEFVITSERKRLVKKFERAFFRASTVDLLFPSGGLNFVVFSFFDSFTTAVSKGVRFRLLTQKTEVSSAIMRKLKDLTASPLFELKFVDVDIDFGICIFDDREVDVCMSGEEEVPSLGTNNRQLLKMAKLFFETHWRSQDFLLLS
jgi:sugar-specific transcriptional regulator TrmB